MLIITDSICLKLISSDTLCYCVGHSFHCVQADKTYSLTVKPQDKIHVITVWKVCDNNYKIVLAAGKELLIFNLANNAFENIQKYEINDWISSAKIYDESCLLVVTGHNIAIKFSVSDSNKLMIVYKTPCEDNSTLYCAKVEGNTFEDSLIFSGTALGDLVLWRPTKPSILYRISAHNGVIFSFDCIRTRNFLTTTSDDRSVKFWNFDHDELSDVYSFTELKYCFGHTARVFKSKIITHNDKLFVISAGEDSIICVWDSTGNLLNKKFVHNGATIWNIDYDDASKTIFSCGSSGNINKFFIGDILDGKTQIESSILYSETFSKLKYEKHLIGITNSNKIVIYKDKGDVLEYQMEECNCSLLESHENKIFVGDKCDIRVFEYDDQEIIYKTCINLDTDEEPRAIQIFRYLQFLSQHNILVCNNKGKCYLLNSKDYSLENSYTIPQCAERWITTACEVNKEFILMGDRCGNLHLYERSANQPICTLKRLHGNLGITNIIPTDTDGKFNYFTTTGHDGTLKEVQVNLIDKKMILFNTRKVPIVWIERIERINGQNFIFGFNDKHFVVYEKTNGIIFEFNCGGGHRFWHVNIKGDSGTATLIYVQNKIVKSVDFKLFTDSASIITTPYTDWHIKSCNVVHIIGQSKSRQVFVSGGEDNLMKIGYFNEENNDCTICHNVISHISSIKCICFKQLPNNETLVLSAGGRAQLCLTRIINSERLKYRDEFSFMLLQSDEQRHRKQRSKVQDINFDAETRFMCMSIYGNDKVIVGCSDGFIRFFDLIQNEDSSFSIETDTEVYYGKCILNIYSCSIDGHSILLTMGTDGIICFWDLTKNITANSRPFYQVKVHDSGINCFDVLVNGTTINVTTGGDDQKLAIIQFELTEGNLTEDSIRLKKCASQNEFHSAQVTGIKFLNEHYILSTGVDKTICKINADSFTIEKFTTSCVPDIKGLILHPDKLSYFVYGSGIEHLPLF